MAVANTSEPKYGGYNYDFIETVPDRLMCSIVCTRVLNNPHLTSCCGQHVCEICLDYWFEKHREISCPHCRAKGQDFHHFLDKKLKREIEELKIHCIHKDKGCQWLGELEELDNHFKSEDGCGFAEVDCPNCSKKKSWIFLVVQKCPKIFRKDLHEHMNKKCKFRLVICTHCKEKQLYFIDLSNHYRTCPQYPLPCPNQCGVTDIPRENVRTHCSRCPLQPVKCPFDEAGCQAKLTRNQLKKHIATYQQTHLHQLMADYSQTKTDLVRTQQAFTNTQLALITTQQNLSRTQQDLARTQQALATTLEALTKIQEVRATKEFEPTIIKSILTNLGTPESKIDKKGQEHGLQFTIPGEFKDNKVWYSPAFYVRTFKTCIRAELNTQTGGLDWSLVVLGTERSKCGDVFIGKLEEWLTINFRLPCMSNPSEMCTQNILSASCDGVLAPQKSYALTIYISDRRSQYCENCMIVSPL